MQSSMQYPMESTVALAFLCILIDINKSFFEKEMPGVSVEITPAFFFDGSFEYQHFDRLGGVLSHLRKVHRADIAQYLGPERTQQMFEEERAVLRMGELG